MILDGEPFLDLSGMLKYASNNTDCSIDKTADNRSSATAPIYGHCRMSHLDHLGSPAKGALDRIWAGTGTGVGKEYLMSKLKQVIVHMTQRDPDKRLSIADYREQLEGIKIASISDADISKIDRKVSQRSNNSDTDDEREAPFPAYFRDVLYPLFLKLHWEGTNPDQRVSIICEVCDCCANFS